MSLIKRKKCFFIIRSFLYLIALLLFIDITFKFIEKFHIANNNKNNLNIKTHFKNSKTLLIKDYHNIFSNQKHYNHENLCQLLPSSIQGKVEIKLKPLSNEDLNKKFTNIFNESSGGHWSPNDCIARYKVAIIVPYRNRDEQLRLFLDHMHQFLPKQLLDYAIYIVEPAEILVFNRGLLMNIGYAEAIKDTDWDCFIFHDVDLLPEDDRNLYYCPVISARHLSVLVNTFNYKLPYDEIFGGVSVINSADFKKINGYSNIYFGWGGEDDDIYKRLKNNSIIVSRYTSDVAKYYMLTHKKDEPNEKRNNFLDNALTRMKNDGINSLKYTVINKFYKRLYTWILVSYNDKPYKDL